MRPEPPAADPGLWTIDRPGPATSDDAAEDATTRIVVLGLGNLIASDDGLGIHVLSRLRELWPPSDESILERHGERVAEVRFVDGGLLGIDLLTEIESADRLLVLDAVDAGRRSGSLVELSADEVLGPRPGRLSVHQVALCDLLGLSRLRGRLPSAVIVLGVQPEDVSAGHGLTPTVAKALPAVVTRARAIVDGWVWSTGVA